jgi:hypothetical protein
MTAPTYPPPGAPQGWDAVYAGTCRTLYERLADQASGPELAHLYHDLADVYGDWPAPGDSAPLLDLRADGGGW